ncbi:autophagy-related protein 3 [Senna tora]|uniref:Autophagy-related protein 3 n=1 Tax=Senna tora TaxID=362788 RepID=A0A835CAA7_9FABA|nr:autophagy-related protein 3 [Senna tora]
MPFSLDSSDDGWLATHGKPKESKSDEDENVPSMESLEISKKGSIKPIASYMGGGEEEEEIPDMADFEEGDNIIERDPVNMFYGTTASGHKCLDPVFHFLNPTPSYSIQFRERIIS